MSNTRTGLDDILDNSENGIIDEWVQVKVVNPTSAPIKLMYANKPWVIPANGETWMPYHGMVIYCGDPRAFDVPGDMRKRYRTDEWARLRVQWGVYDNLETVDAMIPKLEVYSILGNRIITVIDDPDGSSIDVTSQNESELVRARKELALLSQRNEAILKRLDVLEKADSGDVPITVESLKLSTDDTRTETPAVQPLEKPNRLRTGK